jgi:hypothetical protein
MHGNLTIDIADARIFTHESPVVRTRVRIATAGVRVAWGGRAEGFQPRAPDDERSPITNRSIAISDPDWYQRSGFGLGLGVFLIPDPRFRFLSFRILLDA